MARIVVIGANGMLGHVASQLLAQSHDVVATVRRAGDASAPLARSIAPAVLETGIDVRSPGAVTDLLTRHRPDAVVNCVGLIKQRPEARDTALAIELNALLPHRLATACDEVGARLIQISTDCVFSGRRGNYREDDEADPVDTYGRTKFLGEVTHAPHLTLRTSIIGPQLEGTEGLVAWFLAQKGPVRGYRRAVFSGLTTAVLADLLSRIVDEHRGLSGLFHLASAPIAKFDLLEGLAARLGLAITIEPTDTPVIDRSLDPSRFLEATSLAVPSWDAMLDRLAADILARPTQAS